MESVRLIYEQIEEAKRYLLGCSLHQVRPALILLDNAAELLMYRELQHEFALNDGWEPQWEPARAEWIRAGLGPKYTDKEFEPKLRILHFRLNRISEDDRAKIDHSLKYTQFWRELGAKLLKNGIYEPQLGEEFRAWQAVGGPKFTLSKIERW